MARNVQPISDIFPDIGFCYGVLCYMGIVPNFTTWEEAQRIFASKPGYAVSSRPYTIDIANGPIESLWVPWNKKSGIIFEVDLRVREGVVAAENVISDMGTPCAVYPVPSPNMSRPCLIRLSYSYWFVWVKADSDWGIQPDSAVIELWLGSYESQTPLRAERLEKENHCLGGDDDIKYSIKKYSWQGFHKYPYKNSGQDYS